MITTNQIKTFARNNPYVQNWMEGYEGAQNFKLNNRSGDFATNRRNELSYYAHEALANKFPSIFSLNYNKSKTQLLIKTYIDLYGWTTEIYIIARIDYSGKFSIHFNNYGDFRFVSNEHQVFVPCKSIKWDKGAITDFVANWLKSKLYGAGIYTDFMIAHQWTRERLKKGIIKDRAIELQSYSDTDVRKSIKRNLNIDTGHIWLKDAIQAVNKLGKRAQLTKLAKYDMSWLCDLDGDIDEIENEFYNSLEYNTVYI